MEIAGTGMTREAIFERLAEFRRNDIKWQEGRTYGYIFDPGKATLEVGKAAYNEFLSENGLDFTVFPSLLRLERELAAFGARHLRGDDQVVGNFTSGGTESIILAVKAARDCYREKRPDIAAPEMILPATAHAAFHKAAHYLDVKAVTVSVDPETFRADVEKVRGAINARTIMIVGSAPSYAHGVVDPIADLAALAKENDLWMHTDACMGGFLLPYFRRLGEPVPDFDFSVPGVDSISVDLHKYAYTPKGASLVLYRNKALRRHQIFACSGWIGYTIVNNAVQSSKSGGPMAAAWAVINYVGDEGYLEIARKKLAAVKKIAEGIGRIDGLRLLTRPDMCLISFISDEVNVFHIIDEMNQRGWYIQPSLSFDNSPAHIHLSVSASNVGWEDELLKNLAECVQIARTLPEGELTGLIKGSLEGVDLSAISDKEIMGMMAAAGIKDGSLPSRMADINGVLDAMPAQVREKILTAFVNDMFSQP
ncbi:aspartate aminotransferase family protein [uncultured Desulfosarcina sp.]|uniref:pyridoxal phosphate-dependent decarboxylase family protein n=1 Tax=uncultured Desulfosarcina sp. TaxID=218289 RepID=UPI0029C91F5F|nr:aspartate aminotransferase family protein [uncultured Desulfosarcina sp.]